ncbi:thioredoxin family protein [Smaragdicoccus niigatensis]|uniref:thioredoxin family protein n=1 Tax=Smaragdicoccus niigatensis TaxID=359359 RepID=UPI0003A334BE|nr:thioredoxin domain-containing protein [Smaragdicoccus niigatensis]
MAMNEVGNSNFWTTVLKHEQPVVVAFWATWCGACKATMPAVSELGDQGLPIYTVNVGNEPAIAYEYGVTAAPTLKVFDQGKVVKTITGRKTKQELESELAEFL